MLFASTFVFYAVIVVYESANCECKNHVFSDSGIMIAPEPGIKADTNFRLPKQTTTVYWVNSDTRKGNSHSSEKFDKNTRKTVRICNLSL